ncbi:hypothetical protein PMAYCL1PPCAC_04872, partial [Pristionchus mayeri]
CRHLIEPPLAFKIIRHTMTITSVAVTPLCAYIVKSSSAITRPYSNLLVALLMLSVVVDTVVQWVFDPVILMPLLCTFRGAPLINIPLSAAACSAITFSLVAFSGVLYIALFLYRHQV